LFCEAGFCRISFRFSPPPNTKPLAKNQGLLIWRATKNLTVRFWHHLIENCLDPLVLRRLIAGKTIMAGLLLKELKLRHVVERITVWGSFSFACIAPTDRGKNHSYRRV
jgi:hypothetical protein